ncbi:heme lyase CcmF/NrfE family subunit [Vibrio sp. JC009]|uniref:heme lyase CcmF/NrfE family subunit n=1 Tax=Vibrio sp. JC009 TaxID=2912314 RepID=UPI0023AEE85F|nr:heme lyase CcmF/NrfE family subunit [Vibrio sp. JC009]WED20583.1 heme lyase CcmF/NrfE family subunit [Vibrio sp. JC009]
MLAEIGHFSLLLVAVSSLLAVVKSLYDITLSKSEPVSVQLTAAHFSVAFSLISVFALAGCFVYDDFSLAYVSSHSNSQLPVFFKGAAVWGGHEGSLLFWVVMLACWSSAIAFINRKISARFLNYALCSSLFLVSAFAFFTLFASNPFEVNAIIPEEGRDLNPMLQDVGLIFHPPLLYVGYIGFASSFALAMAALWNKQNEEQWLLYARKYALFAWSFLTAGIVLGAWWAYNELGWGGWWFWDPVENASLLPWLTGTALLHSLIAGIHRRSLVRWSLFLSFMTFTLSILGTFVVRSGILTSVHAFAVDPTRGIILLLILFVLVVAGFGSLLARSDKVSSEPVQSVMSKDFLFMLGNIVFSVAMLTVVLGTFYPMLFQLFGLGKISVGAPYFNALFAPLTFVALLLMAVAPWLNWGEEKAPAAKSKLLGILIAASLILGFVLYRAQYAQTEMMPLVTWSLSSFVVLTLILRLLRLPDNAIRLKVLPMLLAHLGVAIAAVGSSMNAYHSVETSAKMAEGSEVVFSRFDLDFEQLELFVGPNYTAERAHMKVNGGLYVIPERRHYAVRVMNMTEPGIKNYWHGDLYITLGEKLKDGSFAVRIQYKAYVMWLWFGGILMVIGGGLGLFTRKDLKVVNVGQ